MTPPATGEKLLDMVVQSGLLSPEVLRPYVGEPDGPRVVANQLVRDRLLTPFQGRQLIAGKVSGYFLSEKYKVLALIGTGGSGHVFLCEHLILLRLVAVKLLQRGVASSTPGGAAAAVERFIREARAVAALDHPNIVRIHDMELTGSIPFMVMEYVDGTSLHQIVSHGGPLSIERAVHCASQAAAGLQHAHEHGLIHRDIKPGNLLLERSGTVKVLDLGLARFRRESPKADNLTARYNDPSIVGTVDYMSPEQAVNGPVDIRSDVYSLGATLYHLLTARPPFEGELVAKKLIAHQLHQPVPITEVRPETPKGVAAILLKMMAKNPDERFQTPGEVVVALAPWTPRTIAPPTSSEMPKLPPSAYRLGLSPGPVSAVAGSGLASLVRWEFPLSPDDGDTPQAADSPTRAPPPVIPQPERTELFTPASVSAVKETPTAALPPSHKKRLLFGAMSGALLAGVIIGLWPLLAGRKERGQTNSSGSTVYVTVTGSGSTAIRPAMEYWAGLYEQQTGVKIKYDGIGSGRGVENMIDRVLDFGCTDAYMTDKQLETAQKARGDVVHIPLVMGAVVATYNLPKVDKPLRITGKVLADIYLGHIRKWDHEAISVSNPGVKLPPEDIVVIHRSDDSGTTSIWTEYLSKVSGEWRDRVGRGTTVKWPCGNEARKSDGVAREVSDRLGAIGYVELSYAMEQNLKVATIRNAGGTWLAPSLESVTAAANARLEDRENPIAPDLRYSLIDPRGEDPYPIAGTTWAVIYSNQPRDKGKEIVRFLRWCVHDGQQHLAQMRYAPLPPHLVKLIDEKLNSIRTD